MLTSKMLTVRKQANKSWSVHFNGSSIVSANHTSGLNFGSNNFTIEFWLYIEAIPTTGAMAIFTKRLSNAYNGYTIFLETDGSLSFAAAATNAGSWDIVNHVKFGTPALNTWVHVSVCRNGNDWYGSLNGHVVTLRTSMATAPYSNTAPIYMGGDSNGVYKYTGYMSNVRIINGTGLYIADFTPPNAALATVAGTQLLTLQSSTLVDNGPNQLGVGIAVGAPTISALAPF